VSSLFDPQTLNEQGTLLVYNEGLFAHEIRLGREIDAHPTLQSRHPIYCRLPGLPARTMPASEHWITSRLAVLNPFSKIENSEDEREEIAATSVAGGGHSARERGTGKSQLRVSHALKSFLVD
jgi:hypothetical protein